MPSLICATTSSSGIRLSAIEAYVFFSTKS
jgi:hypothetical protein